MKLQHLRNEWLQFLILAVPFCAVALLWDKLPYRVPIHWNARGEVDGYAGKALGTMLLPIINLVIALVVSLLVFIDPKLNKLDAEVRASLWRTVKIVRLGITGFLSIISLVTLAAALGWLIEGAQFSRIIYASIALLFIMLGNFMTKLRPNYFIGIRTPWTLESKEVWIKTHRVGSRIMMLGGILMLTLCFLMSPERYVFSILYSFVIYKKQGPVQQPSA